MRLKMVFAVAASAALLSSCAETPVPDRRDEPGPVVAALPVPPPPPVVRPRPVKPLAAIGRINRQGGGFCTGTLIAPDKVLTTASCLWDVRLRRWTSTADLHFLAGYHLGEFLAHRRANAIAIPADIEMTSNGFPLSAVNNWAIMTLDPFIGPVDGIRPIRLARIDGRLRAGTLGPLLRAGYGRLRPHAIQSVRCNAVTLFNPKVLLHDCGTTLTESGFPILVETQQGLRMLGLQMIGLRRPVGGKGLGRALLVTAMERPKKTVLR